MAYGKGLGAVIPAKAGIQILLRYELRLSPEKRIG